MEPSTHLPADADLPALRAAAAKGTARELYQPAIQTVFGTEPRSRGRHG